MTIYFAGTERDAVNGGERVTTDAAWYDPLYSRSALVATPATPAGFTLPNAISTTDLWVGYTQSTYAPPGHAVWGLALILKDASNLTVLSVSVSNFAATATLYNTAGATANTATWQWGSGQVKVRYDFHVYDEGGNAKCECYANNLLVASTSLAGSHRALKVVEITGPANNGLACASELIIADESTIGMRVKTFRPAGQGTQTLWDGDYTDVDDPDIGLTSITTQLPGAAETFTHGYTMTAGTAIRALIVGAAAGSGAADGIHALLGGQEKSFVLPLTPGAAQNLAIYEVNPATGNPYTAAEFNALEFGVRNTSQAG